MVEIEKGPFIYGGPGELRSKYFGEAEHTESEQPIDLPAFAIDRTEVSNAAFKPFADMTRVTGYPVPFYSIDVNSVHFHDADPSYPVSYIDAYEAKAYCEYMGKDLPSDFQWVKAARGGLSVHGEVNPHPRRLYPWGIVADAQCVNQNGDKDGFGWTAPVDAFACGASPYGVLQLSGNVQEWISREGQTDRDSQLRVVRGGGADGEFATEDLTTNHWNPRPPRSAYYTLGIRCVIGGGELVPQQ
jgi:formylglycine-generating enzyme required for sulfatase activity